MPGQDDGVGPHRTASVPWRTGQLMDILVPRRLSVLTIGVNMTPQVWGMSVGVYVLWICKSMRNDSIMGLGGWFSSWWNIYSAFDDRPVGGSLHLIAKDGFTYIQERDCESSKTNKQTPQATYLNPILIEIWPSPFYSLHWFPVYYLGPLKPILVFLFLFWSYSHYSQRLVFHGLFL